MTDESLAGDQLRYFDEEEFQMRMKTFTSPVCEQIDFVRARDESELRCHLETLAWPLYQSLANYRDVRLASNHVGLLPSTLLRRFAQLK